MVLLDQAGQTEKQVAPDPAAPSAGRVEQARWGPLCQMGFQSLLISSVENHNSKVSPMLMIPECLGSFTGSSLPGTTNYGPANGFSDPDSILKLSNAIHSSLPYVLSLAHVNR